jgi:hypothetical protein
MSAQGDFFPAGVNQFIPNMNYASDVEIGGRLRVLLTPVPPIAAAAAAIVSAVAADIARTVPDTNGGIVNTFTNSEAQMSKFGRCLQIIGSAVGMAQVITVRGEDYLGQPMAETLTLNGTTSVNGVKAFRRIRSVSTPGGGTAGTFNLGFRDAFGVPYAVQQNAAGIFSELVDDVNATGGSLGLLVTTAQTLTSADPRGVYSPAGGNVANGARRYTVFYEARKGLLHGLRHFFS